MSHIFGIATSAVAGFPRTRDTESGCDCTSSRSENCELQISSTAMPSDTRGVKAHSATAAPDDLAWQGIRVAEAPESGLG